MIPINYKKLWEDGGYDKDNPLENTIAGVLTEAKKHDIPQDIAELAINEIFMEMAAGRKFSTEGCEQCKCGSNKSGTDATHAMFNRVHSINRQIKIARSDLIERRMNSAIMGHIARENKQYIDENTKPSILSKAWKFLNKPITF